MKRTAAALLAALLLCPLLPVSALAAPNVSAAAAILVDGDTGRVLYEKNADEKRLIASITKLMTALVAVESCDDPTQTVTIERADTLAEGSSMYLKAGEELTVETLLYGLMLSSGNDAALAIARVCAGDVETFVDWMNRRADSLDMKSTHFVNPNGLNDDDHYSTAADMAKLAMEVAENETLAAIVATRSITMGTRTFTNHNKLLWQYEGCEGMKTGYTERAGRTLVSCARRDGRLLVAVTLAAPNDWADHAALFDYGFETYPRKILARAGKDFQQVPVMGSLTRFVAVRTVSDVYFPTAEGEQITAKVTLAQTAQAPVKAGAVAGCLSFYLEQRQVGETYLVYTDDVARNMADSNSLLKKVLEFFAKEKNKTFLDVFYAGKIAL